MVPKRYFPSNSLVDIRRNVVVSQDDYCGKSITISGPSNINHPTVEYFLQHRFYKPYTNQPASLAVVSRYASVYSCLVNTLIKLFSTTQNQPVTTMTVSHRSTTYSARFYYDPAYRSDAKLRSRGWPCHLIRCALGRDEWPYPLYQI